MKKAAGIDPRAIVIGLADRTRLAITRALMEKPCFGEELAHRLSISPSTISFHLKKLEAAGLVLKARDQYYAVYSVKPDILGMTLGELIGGIDDDGSIRERGARAYRDKVLAAFFDDGRLTHLPVQKKKRRVVLEEFVSLFDGGRDYTEAEIDEAILARYEDYCTIRRELVDEKLLVRRRQTYRLAETAGEHRPPVAETDPDKEHGTEVLTVTTADEKATLKRQYKENPPSAGIYRITNRANGKILVGKAMNAQGKLNGQRAQLKWGSHRNKELQRDWKECGEDQFAFEVIDLLEQPADPAQDMGSELSALEELWLNKLQPYGERGYNEMPRRR
jgi:biotin operon repressor